MPNTRRSPERAEENLSDQLAHITGADIWRFSQSRATRQSPGIADRMYVWRKHKLTLWFEAKANIKRYGQTNYQREFEVSVTVSPGVEYLCGTSDDFAQWLQSRGWIQILPSGGVQVLRTTSSERPA